MSSEQEFDEGFQEDVAPGDSAGQEEAPADDHATDADFTDEEWSDADGPAEGGEAGEEQPEDKAARKKKMNMMLLGGAVVVGLGLAYTMMHKKSVPIPLPTNVPIPKGEATETDMVYQDMGDTGNKSGQKKKLTGGFLNDPNLIKKAQKMSDSHVPTQEEQMPEPTHPVEAVHATKPPQPTPIKSPETDTDDNQPLTPMPQEVAGNMVKAAAPPAPAVKQGTPVEAAHVPPPATMPATMPAPTAVTPPAPMAHASATTTNPATPHPANPPGKTGESPFAAPAATAMSESERTSTPSESTGANNGQLDSITSKLDGIESQLKTLEGSVVHRDELSDIRTQINDLTQKVDALSGTASKKAPAGKTAAAPHAKHTRHTIVHKTTAAGTGNTHVQTIWMLKSAMPDMAIVAGSDGRIMTVKPGDHVAGLGRIRSIAEKNGRWVVTGTSGSVHQ